MTRQVITTLVLVCIFFTYPFFIFCQDEVPYDLFASEEPLAMTLNFDIKDLIKRKYRDKYHDATFSCTLENGQEISGEIRVKARGVTRRKQCLLPPLKLNFRDTLTKKSNFFGQKTLKLVAPCKGGNTFQQYVYQEYLIYKMFNVLTEKSFRVRLVDLNYVDSRGKRKAVTYKGFFIEHVDHMAERNDCIEIEGPQVRQSQAESSFMSLHSMFQFMIGNTDWQVPTYHNVKIIRPSKPSDQRLFAIPYDFDYSGMIHTIYAIPNEGLPLESVRQRLYRGVCYSESQFEHTFMLFNNSKAEIYSVVRKCVFLNEKVRLSMIDYLDQFYDILDSPSMVKRTIMDACNR